MPRENVTPPPRPERDPKIRALSDWMMMFWKLGERPYPGDEKDARPSNPITLHDIKKQWEAMLKQNESVPDSLVYLFYSDRYGVDSRKWVSAPDDNLVWLVAENDVVLLSDDLTHHVTCIAYTDHSACRIHFHDPWSDRFFLREGRNQIGAKARDEVDGTVSISIGEFMKAIVGLVTIDTPGLLDAYFAVFPHRLERAAVHLEFGFTLMSSKRPRFLERARDEFRQAQDAYRTDCDDEGEQFAASQHFGTLRLLAYDATRRRDDHGARQLLAAAEKLCADFGLDTLLAPMNEYDLGRIGHAAGSVQNWEESLAFLQRALGLNPDEQEHAILVSHALLGLERPEPVVDILTRALAVNEKTAGEIARRSNARDPRDGFGRGLDDAELASLQGYRMQQLGLRGKALMALGRLGEMQRDWEELARLQQSR